MKITACGSANNVTGALRDVSLGMLDLLFPPECCLCGAPGPLFFCLACRESMVRIKPPYCARCGRPGSRSSCPDCGEVLLNRPEPCQAMREVAQYEGVWRDAIHRFKYDGMRCLAPELAGFLTEWLTCASYVWRQVDVVVPVPGRAGRGWELGFHHSHELARRVADWLDVPLAQPLRRLPGKSQMTLARAERLANAWKIYALRNQASRVSGMRVLLIDDVITTGATARAVASLLKGAGAAKVRMLALARNV